MNVDRDAFFGSANEGKDSEAEGDFLFLLSCPSGLMDHLEIGVLLQAVLPISLIWTLWNVHNVLNPGEKSISVLAMFICYCFYYANGKMLLEKIMLLPPQHPKFTSSSLLQGSGCWPPSYYYPDLGGALDRCRRPHRHHAFPHPSRSIFVADWQVSWA